jgi:endo-1,4-beta-xylanase
MINRRAFLKKMGYGIGLSAFSLSALEYIYPHINALAQNGSEYNVAVNTPLKDRAAAKGLLYGAASFKRLLSSDSEFAKNFVTECSIFVPEWELKWKPLRPSPTTFEFSTFDWLLNFTTSHNLLFRGHTLVWHDDLPNWFNQTINRNNAEKYLLDHISTVVKRHAGKIHSWDVVNEGIAIWDKNPDGYRTSSPWYQLLGPSYIDTAFRAASIADPNAMLVLNQNHLESDGDDKCRLATLKLLERLKAKGTPVHALGIEGHLGGQGYRFNPSKFKSFLREVADLDLKILITEMDVFDYDLPGVVSERDSMVAGLYSDFLTAALQEPAVIAVLSWGLSDKYTWVSKYKPRNDGLSVRSLPLDENFNPKPAWYAIARAFDNAPKRLASTSDIDHNWNQLHSPPEVFAWLNG